MIKAILFDFGGVISVYGRFRPFSEYFAKKHNLNAEQVHDIIHASWEPARLGKTKPEEFWESIAKLSGQDWKEIRQEYIDFHGFRPEMLELIKKLHKHYKIGLLSNQIKDWMCQVIEKYDLAPHFDAFIISYNEGKAKPDPAIYITAAERLGVKPEECLFIDDLEKNIPSAIEIGMKAILFIGCEELIAELKAQKMVF